MPLGIQEAYPRLQEQRPALGQVLDHLWREIRIEKLRGDRTDLDGAGLQVALLLPIVVTAQNGAKHQTKRKCRQQRNRGIAQRQSPADRVEFHRTPYK